MSQIIHTIFRVFSLDRSISFYTKTLGLDVAGPFHHIAMHGEVL